MITSKIKLSREIISVIENRRKKLLFAMYMLSIAVFLFVSIKDIYYNYTADFIIESVSLIFVVISFYVYYKNKKYDYASYAILIIIGFAIISIMVINKFDDYTPIFMIPFFISTFFLFSWKKGILINAIFTSTIVFFTALLKEYFTDSVFLQNQVLISNFIIVLIIILIFTYFYETTRVEAYKLLLESNYKKDLLYKELHHRVKNNLNIVTSMLMLQAQNESKQVKDIIKTSKERIDSIAMVHSMLYVSDNMEKVDVKAFLEKLSQNLKTTSDDNINKQFQICF